MNMDTATQSASSSWRVPVGLALVAAGAGLLVTIPGVHDFCARALKSDAAQQLLGDIAAASGRRGMDAALNLAR